MDAGIDDKFKKSNKQKEGKQGDLLFDVQVAEKAPDDKEEETSKYEKDLNEVLIEQGDYDPKKDLENYNYPDIKLLDLYGQEQLEINKAELEQNKNQIVQTLLNYNIEISKISATVGATITLYEIVPAAGVRISKIRGLQDDIALSLSALGIRIIAPIPGKGTVGIEVPNQKKEIVPLRRLLASEKYMNSKMELPIALGTGISTGTFVADLTKMPHMLMAGATGQGKSVGINTVLVSLLYKKHPSQLKFVLIDPKKVELSIYNRIEKHFLAKLPDEEEAIITDTLKVVSALNALCVEMDNRYDLLKLNPEKGHRFLPYIVLVIDEFSDLIMTAGKDVEIPLTRLAQLARAIGIHLIIATQRPTVNIITGTIKANFPVRIAFRVTSVVDSKTILDAGGANQLIGRGDMLLVQGADVHRLQCAFVDTPEVERVTEFIESQQGYSDAFMLPEAPLETKGKGSGKSKSVERDPLFVEAAKLVVGAQSGSTSMIQRRMSLGYNRAGRLMDQLEANGIVGPNLGSKARDVYVPDLHELEKLLTV
ncbi:UNVERIFIED_CONTAM: hypothetical protein GTU68_011334 [Idotea baltica]|nr:hypothetical protein [Idotea baltica]